MKKNYKIYKYTNIINNKIYIGITNKTLAQRAGANGSNYQYCKKFYAAIKKYGWNNFVPTILEKNLTKEQACSLEKKYINFYNSQEEGYNITSGGENAITSHTGKPVYVFDETHYLIATICSIQMCEKLFKTGENTIRRNINKKWVDNLFFSSEKTVEIFPTTVLKRINPTKEIKLPHTVEVIAHKNTEKKQFNSVSECARYFGVTPGAVNKWIAKGSPNKNGWIFTRELPTINYKKTHGFKRGERI